MNRGQLVTAGVVLALVAIALVALLYRPTNPGAVEPLAIEPLPKSKIDGPRPRPAPAPAPAQEAPEPAPEPAAAPEPIPVEARRDYNYAMDDAVREAREICLQPWANLEGPDAPTTVVMDAVLTDGQLTDVSVRGIGDVPDDVMDCARDAAWKVEWPSFEHRGELRFQRSFTVAPRPE